LSAKMQIDYFWGLTPCGVVGYQSSGAPCCRHL